MSDDFYIITITALLPLTAGMLVSQANPYHALVIRGILGAIAALVYALFGAADVALTEALVGTMLSITLYAVAVRSSLSMRLGVIEKFSDKDTLKDELSQPSPELLSILKRTLSKYHMRLEILPYDNIQALRKALVEREIHAIYLSSSPDQESLNQIQTRVSRLYDIMKTDISSDSIHLSKFNTDTDFIDAENTPHLTENHV